MDVGVWLRKLGLERYEPAFRDNNITGEVLRALTAEDLKDLGVLLVGDRRVLLEAIGSLRTEARSGSASLLDERPSADSPATVATERRQLTVMFCDLVGSTALSSKLDPEDLRMVLTSFQKAVSEAVRQFDGHVAKYLGDGILVYFGYPQAHEDDAERAIRASLAALAAVHDLVPAPGIRLDARVGISTGLVVVGDIAEEGVSETGAISGETPNLAARLQGVAAPGEIVIGQSTHRLVAGTFDCEALGPQNLKGIATPTNAWCVRGPSRAKSRFDARHGATLTEFVGRGDEIALVLRRWEQAKSSEGQVVLISGEPGLGKSRLTQHVRQRLAGDPHVALQYQCSPHNTGSVLYPVVSQLTFAAGIAADEPAPTKLDKLEALLGMGTNDVVAVAPLFADLLSIPHAGRYPALDLTPQTQKMRTLEALKDQLLGLARRQPVFLVFEDLHWLDPTTQDLLDLIVDKIQNARVLALMTFRPEYQPRWVGQSHVALMALNRLNQRHCAELARHVVAKSALPAATLDAIVQRTEGVPLFIEELTRAMLEGGTSEAVPTTIQGSLLARLDRLGPAKQVAQIAAVIGREFDHALLAAVSPIAGPEFEEALGRLVDSELVFRRGLPPEAAYMFKHALVQDTAYDSLLKSRRRKIHADIVAALRRLFPALEANQPELLAHHYSHAGLNELAVDYWERAGNRALQRSANVEARRHYLVAVALLDALPTEIRASRELSLQLSLGSALTSVEGYSATATGEAYRRARDLCLELGDKEHLFPALYGVWNFDTIAGQQEKAKQTADALVRLAEEKGEPAPLLAAYSALGMTLTFMGSWLDGSDFFGKCIALYDPQRDHSLKIEYGEDPCVQAYCSGAFCLWNLGFPDQALKSLSDGLHLAEQLQHANSKAYGLAVAPLIYSWIRDPQETLRTSVTCSAFAKDNGLPFWEGLARIYGGWALSHLGRGTDGIAEIRAGFDVFLATGSEATMTGAQAALADAYRVAGLYDEALIAVDQGIRFAKDNSEGFREAELFRVKGAVLLEQTSPDSIQAEKSLADGLAVARKQQARSMELRIATDLARLWRAQGKASEALDLLRPACDWFTEGFGTPDLKEATSLLEDLGVRDVV